jgi:hypothetical protein
MPTALYKGRQWRRLIRIEKAALLTLRGYPNDAIADHIGIHVQTLIYIKQTPEFRSRMIALQTGVIEQHDIAIREDEEYQREELKAMVPIALLKMKELAMSSNQTIAYRAAQDILDREGTHAKVSRSAIDIKEQVNFTAVNQVAKSILDVLQVPPSSASLEDQAKTQDDITSEFTKGATDSSSQIYQMEEQMMADSLAELDVHRLKVN